MKRAILILITLLCVVSLNTLSLQGQEGSILLKHKEIQNQFPDGIVFEAVAETTSPATIQEIKLEVKVKGSTRLSYAFLEFEPATSVQGKYLLRTGGAQYKPPGTLLEYSFIITDSAGRTLETERETFLYLDNRFQWEKVAEGLLEVYYYGPTAGRAQLILKAGSATVARMGALFGVMPEQPIRVIAYNDYSQMASALPFVSRATQTGLLTQGIAFYEYGVLLLLAGDPRADGTTSHEVTHMLVREATKEAFINLPAWLNEGLAEYANINPGQSYDVFLSEAISSNTLFPIRHLQTFPGVPRENLLAYGQARSVVQYLINTYGESKMRELFAAFRQGLPIDEALKKVYGFDQDGLDNAWRKSLGLPPLEKEEPTQKGSVPAVKGKWWEFSRTTVIVTIATIVTGGLLLGIVLRRRARSRSR